MSIAAASRPGCIFPAAAERVSWLATGWNYMYAEAEFSETELGQQFASLRRPLLLAAQRPAGCWAGPSSVSFTDASMSISPADGPVAGG